MVITIMARIVFFLLGINFNIVDIVVNNINTMSNL